MAVREARLWIARYSTERLETTVTKRQASGQYETAWFSIKNWLLCSRVKPWRKKCNLPARVGSVFIRIHRKNGCTRWVNIVMVERIVGKSTSSIGCFEPYDGRAAAFMNEEVTDWRIRRVWYCLCMCWYEWWRIPEFGTTDEFSNDAQNNASCLSTKTILEEREGGLSVSNQVGK